MRRPRVCLPRIEFHFSAFFRHFPIEIFHFRLSRMRPFEDIIDQMTTNAAAWITYAQNRSDDLIEPPTPFSNSLTQFQKLLLFKCLQPTKIIQCVRWHIESTLGIGFVDPPLFDLQSAFADSACNRPLLFLLSPGSSPIQSISRFAATQPIDSDRIKYLSLGRQPHSVIMKYIEEAIKTGQWLVLQNCHLATDFMPALERICENLAPDTTHSDFRLWLTCEPNESVPLSVLHSCNLLVNESPKRLRANLVKSFAMQPFSNEDWFDKKSTELKTMLYSLMRFHAVVKERSSYGALAWSEDYVFTSTDMRFGIDHMTCDLEANSFSFETIRFLISDCIYGGRVTNSIDQICLEAIANMEIPTRGRNVMPQPIELENIRKFINDMPMDANVEDLGFDRNVESIRLKAEIDEFIEGVQCNRLAPPNEVRKMLNIIFVQFLFENFLKFQLKLFTADNEIIIKQAATETLSLLPTIFGETERVAVDDGDYLNAILYHEINQYQNLLKRIRNSCKRAINVIEGMRRSLDLCFQDRIDAFRRDIFNHAVFLFQCQTIQVDFQMSAICTLINLL